MVNFRLVPRVLVVGIAALLPADRDDVSQNRLSHDWRLVNGHNWQIATGTTESTSETDAREGTRGSCPAGMVDVNGRMKTDALGSIEEMQKTTCIDWIDQRFPERCARFDRASWLRLSEGLPTRAMHFCIDRFEFPNELGAYPLIEVSWQEASAFCIEKGERLCTEAEWTFACEGEEATPYPTGYVRDSRVCVIDRPWLPVDENALRIRESPTALAEIDYLWQGESSGSRPACRSAFGVYDLTGNVDEWASSTHAGEKPSILKGGYWGPVRDRCRPSTRVHEETFSYYQQGFRCCRDLDASVGGP